MNLSTVLTQEGEIVVETPEPGERCRACNRRVPKPRQSSSPATRRLVIVLPTERADWLEEALEALQDFVGADPESYPRGTLVEALALLGGQQREELVVFFERSQL